MRLPRPSLPLTPNGAWYCLLINQAATPGLGTLWGGRRLVGGLQLAPAAAGFCLIVWYLWRDVFQNGMREVMDEPLLPSAHAAATWGAILFGLAWLWAWFSSISLLKEAQARERAKPPKLAALQ